MKNNKEMCIRDSAKTYHYRLRCSAVDDPFDYETCHRVNGPLDLAAMHK